MGTLPVQVLAAPQQARAWGTEHLLPTAAPTSSGGVPAAGTHPSTGQVDPRNEAIGAQGCCPLRCLFV